MATQARLAVDARGVALAAYVNYDVAGAGARVQLGLVRLSSGDPNPT